MESARGPSPTSSYARPGGTSHDRLQQPRRALPRSARERQGHRHLHALLLHGAQPRLRVADEGAADQPVREDGRVPPMIIVGVDPGVTGALALYSKGQLDSVADMPVLGWRFECICLEEMLRGCALL